MSRVSKAINMPATLRSRALAIVMPVLVASVISGCAGSMVGSRLAGDRDMMVDRQMLTEKIFNTCRRETTPLMARPTSPLAGKCECAAVSFHNYATDAELDAVRNLWAMYGTGTEFTHKVLGVTESFHSTHCSANDRGRSALELTRLHGVDASAPITSTGVLADGVILTEELNSADYSTPGTSIISGEVISENIETLSADQVLGTSGTIVASVGDSDVTRFEMSPSAFKDRDLVRFVQRKLKGLGFDPGPLDGVVGQKTREALASYASSQNMPAGTSHEDIMSSLVF